MSISSEITRIQNKRDLSFIEVENKGVTVPEGSTIDDLPGLIAQIEQGSGSGSGGIIYQDLDGYLNLSEEEANVISIVDTLDTAGGTVRTITGAVESGYTDDEWLSKTVSGPIVYSGTEYKLSLDGFSQVTFFSAPNLLSLYNANYFFRNCSSLTSVKLTALQKMYGQSIFEGTKISVLVLPSFATDNLSNQAIIGGNTFKGVTTLIAVDLKRCTRIDGNAFLNASNFSTLIIRGLGNVNHDSVSLANITAFDGTPFVSDGSGGTLYVPENDISFYQSATNWSTILSYANNQILPIEGSIYETQYADGTPIT